MIKSCTLQGDFWVILFFSFKAQVTQGLLVKDYPSLISDVEYEIFKRKWEYLFAIHSHHLLDTRGCWSPICQMSDLEGSRIDAGNQVFCIRATRALMEGKCDCDCGQGGPYRFNEICWIWNLRTRCALENVPQPLQITRLTLTETINEPSQITTRARATATLHIYCTSWVKFLKLALIDTSERAGMII